jgi:hypothetical protein
MPTRIAWMGTVFLTLLVSSVTGQVVAYSPVVGEAHFDFELPSIQDGMPIRLSSFRGKKVLLIHFASW